MKYKAFIILLAAAATAHAQSTPSKVTIVKVSSLADSGTGTLRDCVNKTFPRVCLFEVSGRIKLKSNLEIKQPDLIIAGQSAPSPGILISNATVRVKARNVTIEHLAIRVGDDADGPNPSERDSLSVQTAQAQNVTLRNLSLSWAIDENFSTYGPVKDVRLEDSIISEALYNSLHPKGAHSMGALVGETARNVSFVGNLLAANNDRNVRWKFDTTGEMISNLIYGWGGTSSWNITNLSDIEKNNKPTFLDIIGNVYVAGPGGAKNPTVVYAEETAKTSKVYLQDNIAPNLTNLSATNISSTRVAGTTAEEQPANQTFEAVLKNAGARPWDRNADDLRIIAGVRSRTLAIRDRVGTWPVIPENTRKLDLPTTPITLDQLDSILKYFEQDIVSTGSRGTGDDKQQATPTPAPQPTVGTNGSGSGDGSKTRSGGDDTNVTSDDGNKLTPQPTPTVIQTKPTKRRPWIRAMSAWKPVAKHLCCSRQGWNELRSVARSYPSIVNRCEKLLCARRVPWKSKIF